jgi:hypothetical protein
VCARSHWVWGPSIRRPARTASQIYQISLSPSAYPIERVIGHFMWARAASAFSPPVAAPDVLPVLRHSGRENVRVPAAGGPPVQFMMGHSRLTLSRPSHYFLPMRDFSFSPLFECTPPARPLAPPPFCRCCCCEGSGVLSVGSTFTPSQRPAPQAWTFPTCSG